MARRQQALAVLLAATLLLGALIAGVRISEQPPPAQVELATNPQEQRTTTGVATQQRMFGFIEEEISENTERETPGDFVIREVAGTANGGFLLAGVTDSGAPKTTLRRISSNGDTVWAYQSTPNTYTDIAAVAPAPNDGAYILQSSRRTIWSPPHQGDATLVRIDDKGDPGWQRAVNASGNTVAAATEIAARERSVVVAHRRQGDQEIRVAAYSDDNHTRFSRTYPLSGLPTSLQVTATSSLLSGVSTNGTPWLLGVNADGQTTITETYPSLGTGQFIGAVPTTGRNAVLAARLGGDSLPAIDRVRIAGVNQNGTQWIRTHARSDQILSEKIFATNQTTVLVGWGEGETERGHVVHAVSLNADGTKRFQMHTTVQSEPTTVALNNGTVAIATLNGFRLWGISGILSSEPQPNQTARFSHGGELLSTGTTTCEENRSC